MRFTVLGCSGGIGAPDAHTTGFLVDDDTLIDAGTGLSTLPLADLARIDRVFLTHSHLDHLACLPMLLDSCGDLRHAPVALLGLPDTLAALRAHMFNDIMWPDFSRIPSPASPYLSYAPLTPEQPQPLAGGQITPLAVTHGVPALAYLLESAHGSLLFSGDTVGDAAFWAQVEARPALTHLVVEVAFPDRQAEVARQAGHIHPAAIIERLRRLPAALKIHITHTKPGGAADIAATLDAALGPGRLDYLRNGQVIDF